MSFLNFCVICGDDTTMPQVCDYCSGGYIERTITAFKRAVHVLDLEFGACYNCGYIYDADDSEHNPDCELLILMNFWGEREANSDAL